MRTAADNVAFLLALIVIFAIPVSWLFDRLFDEPLDIATECDIARVASSGYSQCFLSPACNMSEEELVEMHQHQKNTVLYCGMQDEIDRIAAERGNGTTS